MKFAALHLVSGPDIQAARRLHNCDGLNDEDSSHILFHQHGWDPKSSFRFGDDAAHLPFYLQHIAAAAMVVVDGEDVSLSSIEARGEKGEKQLLAELNQQLSELAEDSLVFAWEGGKQTMPLLKARRSLHGITLSLPAKNESLAAEYHNEYIDRDERQLDHIVTLLELAPSMRPLNVAADQAGRLAAQQHADKRALQIAFLATRRLHANSDLGADIAGNLEHTIRQLLEQLVSP